MFFKLKYNCITHHLTIFLVTFLKYLNVKIYCVNFSCLIKTMLMINFN